jgi:hypothetical protein
MPVTKRRKRVAAPCLTHGEGCMIRYTTCQVEVDPRSSIDEFPCERHGKHCRLQFSSCRRRKRWCECMPRKLLVGIGARALADWDRQHDADGNPNEYHAPPSPESEAALTAAIEQAERLGEPYPYPNGGTYPYDQATGRTPERGNLLRSGEAIHAGSTPPIPDRGRSSRSLADPGLPARRRSRRPSLTATAPDYGRYGWIRPGGEES